MNACLCYFHGPHLCNRCQEMERRFQAQLIAECDARTCTQKRCDRCLHWRLQDYLSRFGLRGNRFYTPALQPDLKPLPISREVQSRTHYWRLFEGAKVPFKHDLKGIVMLTRAPANLRGPLGGLVMTEVFIPAVVVGEFSVQGLEFVNLEDAVNWAMEVINEGPDA